MGPRRGQGAYYPVRISIETAVLDSRRRHHRTSTLGNPCRRRRPDAPSGEERPLDPGGGALVAPLVRWDCGHSRSRSGQPSNASDAGGSDGVGDRHRRFAPQRLPAAPDGGRIHRYDHPVEERLALNPDGEGESTAVTWQPAWMGHVLTHGNGYAEIQRTGRGETYGLHLLEPATTAAIRVDGKLRTGSLTASTSCPPMSCISPASVMTASPATATCDSCGARSAWASPRKRTPPITSRTAPSPAVWSRTPEARSRGDPHVARRLGRPPRGPGRGNAWPYSSKAAKWNSTSTDPEKAQLIESRKYQLLEVLRPWRVPPHKAGDFSQSHLANIEASNLDYLMTALMYWLVAIEQQCCLKLFTPPNARPVSA